MRIHRRWLLRGLAASLLAVTVTCAGGPRLPRPHRDPLFEPVRHQFTLPNGLSVIVVPDFTTKLVEVGMRYEVGIVDDPPGKVGLAHLAEHLLFEQRVGGPDQPTLGERQGEVALESNAFTSLDWTHYLAVARAEELPKLIEFEAQRMQIGCAAIDEQTFQREREIVRNELRQRFAGPSHQVRRWLIQLAYPAGHPYRNDGMGDEEQLEAITYGDVCSFIGQHYAPGRANLVITGRVLPLKAEALVTHWFGKIPGRTVTLPRTIDQIRVGGPTVIRSLDVDTPTLYLMWPSPPLHGTDGMGVKAMFFQVYLEVVAALFDDDKGEDLVSSVNRGVIGGERAPTLVLSFSLWDADDAAKVEKLARAAADKALMKPGEGYMSLFAVRTYRQLLNDFEPLSHRSLLYADYLQFDPAGNIRNDLDRLRHLRLWVVKGAANELRRRGGPVGVLVRSDPDAQVKWERADVQYEATHNTAAAYLRFIKAADAHKPLPVVLDDAKADRARRLTLDNGLEVVLLPSHWVPTVEMRILFHSGNIHEPPAAAGLAWMAADMLSPPELKDLDLRAVLGGVTGSTSTQVADDSTVFRLGGLESNVDYMIQALSEWIRNGTYEADDLSELKETTRKHLRRSKVRAGRDVSGELYAALFGAGHPYARLGVPTTATIEAVQLADLKQFRTANYTASNATLIVTGRFDPDLVEAHIRHWFGDWATVERTTQAPVPAISRGHAVHLAVERPDEPMVSILLAFPSPTSLDDDYAARLVLADMLSLRVEVVRTRLAASYGIHAGFATTAGPGYFYISGKVDALRAGESIAAVRAELVALRTGERFEVDFAYARRRVARDRIGQLSSLDATAGQLTTAARLGLQPGFFSQLVRRVAGLTPADVQQLLARELRPDAEVVLITGPRDAVERAYAELGVTEVDFVD